jgi:N6-adenosine-specific RNA methylase IME4
MIAQLTVGNSRAQLAAMQDLSDVKSLRDKAEAARKFAKTAKLKLEQQNECAEVKLWAERRAGEILRQFLQDGQRTSGRGKGRGSLVELRDLGIDKKQSHRWQLIAAIPEETFEVRIAEIKQQAREITSAEFLVIAKRQSSIRAAKVRKQTIKPTEKNGVYSSIDELLHTGNKFKCIYADPPWKYSNQSTRGSTDNHYETMDLESIKAMRVCDLAEDDSHLHLWTTSPLLPEALELMQEWGFTYKSHFIWTKPQMGMGNYWRVSHEILLFGVRGKLPFNDRSLRSWKELPRRRHSAKPAEVRAMVERATPGPRLELFGRDRVTGWVVVGNQVSPQGVLL